MRIGTPRNDTQLMQPLFSIITPTYNRAYVLWKVIQSVQAQTYPFWELLIIDDGSTDVTKQVVAEFQKDPRVKFVSIAHAGRPATARNEGLRLAQGDIISYVDSDDVIYPNYLSVALEFFQKYHDKQFAVCNYNRRLELYDNEFRLVDFTESSSSQKSPIVLQDFYHWKVKTCGTGLFHRREVLSSGVCWDENLAVLDDLDFIMQLGNQNPEGFMHIPYVLFEYLQKYGGDGICSNTNYAGWAEGFDQLFQKHKDDVLLQGQTWHPERVDKYRRMQRQVEAGDIPSAVYKYFPDQGKKAGLLN